MSTTYQGQKPQSSLSIPYLSAQVNRFHRGTTIAGLTHGHPSADPTADGLYDWNNPMLTLFTRDMTPEILALQPSIVLKRRISSARNYSKNISKAKRWVIPGGSNNDGLAYHGGDSSTNSFGAAPGEFINFSGIPNNSIVGYNHIAFDSYELPANRCVSDYTTSNFLQMLQRAVREEDWTSAIRYSQHKRKDNFYLTFQVVLAIPNPNWTPTNHQNKYLFGDGDTIIVEPQAQTFSDGVGTTNHYIGWRAKVR